MQRGPRVGAMQVHFCYHLKTYNVIASFKISSVKHACLVSLRHLSIRLHLSDYRIFSRTQITSFKFAAEFLMKAFTGATGVATSPRGHRKIVSFGTIFMTLTNYIYVRVRTHQIYWMSLEYVEQNPEYIEWTLEYIEWNLTDVIIASCISDILLHNINFFFKYPTKGKREQWVSPAMNNSWCYLLRCKEATKSQFRSVLTNNQVNQY